MTLLEVLVPQEYSLKLIRKIEKCGRIEIMFTIVGLGNIGEEYANTRHNVGWSTLEYFIAAHNLPSLSTSRTANGALSEGCVANQDVTILFPHTYMNNSGAAVRKMLDGWTEFKNLIVVHDDIDLPLGDVRIGIDRGSGGHNGVQSIIDSLGSKNFVRIRVGIGEKNIFGVLRRPQGEALSKFVLGTFKKRDAEALTAMNTKVDTALIEILKNGVEKAMNTCNVK